MTVLAVSNRQYSYSPTVLGRVGLDHECETHAGHVSPTGQTNTRKLRLSLPNLRKIFSIHFNCNSQLPLNFLKNTFY